jgi:hypothetical protein
VVVRQQPLYRSRVVVRDRFSTGGIGRGRFVNSY